MLLIANYFRLITRLFIWVFIKLIKKVIWWENYALRLYTVPRYIIPLLLMLRDFSLTTAKVLIDMASVDYYMRAATSERFHVHYFLLSLQWNFRFQVIMPASMTKNSPTITKVFRNSLWLEREVWDMMGIKFLNRSLRRILTDYGFKNHPLTKNFPLTGFVEHWYHEPQRVIVREPVELMQEYRMFTFSPVDMIITSYTTQTIY